MLVRMLRGTGGPNGIACLEGEVHDLPDQLAFVWIRTGRAIAADAAPLVDAGLVTINGDPMVEAAPSPVKRRR